MQNHILRIQKWIKIYMLKAPDVARWKLIVSLEGPQMSRRMNEAHLEQFKYSKPYSNRCFHPGLTCLLGWRVGSSDPPWHGACNHPESLFGCLHSHKAGKWIVWPRKGK